MISRTPLGENESRCGEQVFSSRSVKVVENIQRILGLRRDGGSVPPPVASITLSLFAHLSINHFQKCSAVVFCTDQFPQWRTKSGFRQIKAKSMPIVPTSPGMGVCTTSARRTSRIRTGALRMSQKRKTIFRHNPRPDGLVKGAIERLRPLTAIPPTRVVKEEQGTTNLVASKSSDRACIWNG